MNKFFKSIKTFFHQHDIEPKNSFVPRFYAKHGGIDYCGTRRTFGLFCKCNTCGEDVLVGTIKTNLEGKLNE